MGDAIIHFIFISLLLNPHTYITIGYALMILVICWAVFMAIGFLSWIVRFLLFMYKFSLGILQFIGLVKRKNDKSSSNTSDFRSVLGEGKIVDLGEHIGVLTRISKKQLAEEYLQEQKKKKSYSEQMGEAMDQEAQAKGW